MTNVDLKVLIQCRKNLSQVLGLLQGTLDGFFETVTKHNPSIENQSIQLALAKAIKKTKYARELFDVSIESLGTQNE